MTEFVPQSVPLFSVGVFEVIFFIIFVVISILGQIFNKEKENPKPRPRPNDLPGENSDDPLETEIAEFVRRAQAEGEIIDAEPLSNQPASHSQPRRNFSEGSVLLDSRNEERAERQLSTNQLTTNRPKLVSKIEERDEQMDAHVQEVFDHQLGKLKPASNMEQADTDEPSALLSPDQIREMFASQDDVRKAIIMNEILTSPSNKWD